MKTRTSGTLVAVALLLMSAGATGQSGGPYELTWSTVDGGGLSSGGPYVVAGVIGQPDAGVLTGGPYELRGGFKAGGAVATGIDDPDRGVQHPTSMRLHPNPFNPSTTVQFHLQHEENVDVRVYDVSGRLVRTLLNERRPAGTHNITWDGIDASGSQVASGVYLVVMEAGAFRETRKITLLK